MSSVGNLIRSIEEERLPRMRKRLEAFEIQGMRTGARHGEGPYKDTTDADHRRVKDQVAEYEEILAALKQGEMP